MNHVEIATVDRASLAVSEVPAPGDLRFLEDRIDEENMVRTGAFDARVLALIVRDREQGIVAGLHGWTWCESCEVKALWVHPAWRARGLGSGLMRMAEREARARGARQVVLSTHSFQAPEFYRRLGYETTGEVEGHPAGHRSLLLRKRL